MGEKGHIAPGELIVGCDSHITTYGAFGAAGTGIGVTETAYVIATDALWMRVPPTLKFVLEGVIPAGVMSKDISLYLAGRYTADVAQYKAVEFTGRANREMSIASRMTMANMGVEIGAKFAFFEADEKALAYLDVRGSGMARRPVRPFAADPDAKYNTCTRLTSRASSRR
jgi:homoaconitase/3-isopropylmalate dehydratase large subunit